MYDIEIGRKQVTFPVNRGSEVEKPFSAYTGNEDYAFVCYSHSDAEIIYADLVQLKEGGVNLWYDEGIPAGTAWRGEIANSIKGASKFIFFISNASLNSTHCLREVDYALNNNIEILPVYLEEIALPPELDLVLNRVQGLYRDNDASYMEHLVKALQGGSVLRPLSPGKSGKKSKWIIPILMVTAVLGYLGFSYQNAEKNRQRNENAQVSSAQPGAFEKYLGGVGLIERWAEGDNLDTAINLLQQSVSLDPDFALGYARLAEAQLIKYELLGDATWLDQAVANSNKALKLNPGLAPIQVVAGRIQVSQGNYDLAFATLERALAIDPNDAKSNQALAKLYSQLGKKEQAEALYKKAITLEPDNLFILDDFGNYLNNQGRYEEAIVQWQTIIRMAPDYYSVMVNMGSVLFSSGRISEAITILERANQIQPTYMAYANLGAAYGGMGRYVESVEALQKALEFIQKNWLAWGNLAYAYSWKGDAEAEALDAFNQAIALAESAREKRPRDPFVLTDLALYYAKTNQQEFSIQRLKTAMVLAPDSGDVYASAAEVYELFGQRDNAVDVLKKSVELGYPRHLFFRNPEFADLLKDVEI